MPDAIARATSHHDEPTCAVALFGAEELVLLWCNERFTSLLFDDCEPESPVGRRFADFSPLTYATRGSAMRRVAETGERECGAEHLFSVEDGLRVYRWAVYRPQPGMLLTLIDCEGVRPERPDDSLGFDG